MKNRLMLLLFLSCLPLFIWAANDHPAVCLNMIVKNESKIITRLLNSVLPIIDTYCICDTGSTDNTKEIIIEFFNEHGITGKIVEKPFKNF